VPQYLADKPFTQTAATRANLVGVSVKPEYAARFRAVVLDEMKQSVARERGVLAMYAATDAKQPEKWYFFEIYADEAAYQAHRATPHFQNYLKQTADMVQDKNFTEITPALLQNKGGLRFEAE
jgi:antibiotic biosynthesis monooxygenase